MKMRNNKTLSTLITSLLLAGLIIFSSSAIFARTDLDNDKPPTIIKKSVIQNYIRGLKSDNEGLRKSCIYFSGKYKISESESVLKDQYKEEENSETKLLLFHALYQIGDKFAVNTVKNYLKGLTSDNEGVRKSCINFVGEYKITEAADILTDQLQKETNPEIQGLLALALNEFTGNDVNSSLVGNSK
jgi:HEAT repeat protein